MKELDISNFDTKKVLTMHGMFKGCSALKELNLPNLNFNINNNNYMRSMFSGCSSELQRKIRAQFKSLKEEAFH